MITKQTFIRGGRKAGRIIWDLSRFIVPAVFIVKILEFSGWLYKIADFFGPFMAYMGLPGEGALVFLFGQVAIYSATGAMVTLGLTAKQLTISCAMITMCHAIILETTIVGRGGANGLLNAGMRLTAAMVAGIVLNLIIPGV